MALSRLQTRQVSGFFPLAQLADALEAAGVAVRRFPTRLHVDIGEDTVQVDVQPAGVSREGLGRETVTATLTLPGDGLAGWRAASTIADRFPLGYVSTTLDFQLEFGTRFTAFQDDEAGTGLAILFLQAYVPLLPAVARAAIDPPRTGKRDFPQFRPWTFFGLRNACGRLAAMGIPARLNRAADTLTAEIALPDEHSHGSSLEGPVRLRLGTDAWHPVAGAGLQFALRFDLKGENRHDLAGTLNRLERDLVDYPPGIGGWVAGKGCLLYGGLIPDEWHRPDYRETLPVNLVVWLTWRAKLCAAFIKPYLNGQYEPLVPPCSNAPGRKLPRLPRGGYCTSRGAPRRPKVQKVDAYTLDEHVVLASYFGVPAPTECSGLTVDGALERLGTPEILDLHTSTEAAVAKILLESCQDDLPHWVASGDQILITARTPEDATARPQRKVTALSAHLFTINWATSGPGFEWPAMYRLNFVPVYQRYVVTTSADSTDALGAADFAVDHFGPEEDILEATGRIIRGYWQRKLDTYDHSRFECVIEGARVPEETVVAWADEVWGPEDGTAEEDEED